jgi:hypothetical protein
VKLGVGLRHSRKSGSRSPTSLLLGSFTKRLSSVLHATPRSPRDLFKIARNASAESQLPEFGSSREASKRALPRAAPKRGTPEIGPTLPRADAAIEPDHRVGRCADRVRAFLVHGPMAVGINQNLDQNDRIAFDHRVHSRDAVGIRRTLAVRSEFKLRHPDHSITKARRSSSISDGEGRAPNCPTGSAARSP